MQVMTAFFPWLHAETGETLCKRKLRGDAKRVKSLLISLVSDERGVKFYKVKCVLTNKLCMLLNDRSAKKIK